MAQTMMTRFCHLQRLLNQPLPESQAPNPRPNRNVGKVFELDDLTYALLLTYYQEIGAEWVDHRKLPYAVGSQVLTPSAREVQGLEGQDGVRFSKKESHNMVKCFHDGKGWWGRVLNIIKVEESNDLIVLIRVLHMVQDPSLAQVFERAGMVRLTQSSELKVFPQKSIVSTLPYRELEANKLGCPVRSWLVMGVTVAENNQGLDQDLDMVHVARDLGTANADGSEAMDIDEDY